MDDPGMRERVLSQARDVLGGDACTAWTADWPYEWAEVLLASSAPVTTIPPGLSEPGAEISRDYLERTIATVRNHRAADNCWPQWANIFADEIERLWDQIDAADAAFQWISDNYRKVIVQMPTGLFQRLSRHAWKEGGW